MSTRILAVLLILACCGLAQSKPTASSTSTPTNDELLLQGKKIFVVTKTFYVKKEQLESGLINRKDLTAWGIQVVRSQADADLILTVERAPFRSRFPFTFTDRESGVVVLGGSVTSVFGSVAGRIAEQLAGRLKEINTKSSH